MSLSNGKQKINIQKKNKITMRVLSCLLRCKCNVFWCLVGFLIQISGFFEMIGLDRFCFKNVYLLTQKLIV